MMKLCSIEMGDRTTTDEYDAQYSHVQKGLEQLQKWFRKCIANENKAAASEAVEQPIAGSDPVVEED